MFKEIPIKKFGETNNNIPEDIQAFIEAKKILGENKLNDPEIREKPSALKANIKKLLFAFSLLMGTQACAGIAPNMTNTFQKKTDAKIKAEEAMDRNSNVQDKYVDKTSKVDQKQESKTEIAERDLDNLLSIYNKKYKQLENLKNKSKDAYNILLNLYKSKTTTFDGEKRQDDLHIINDALNKNEQLVSSLIGTILLENKTYHFKSIVHKGIYKFNEQLKNNMHYVQSPERESKELAIEGTPKNKFQKILNSINENTLRIIDKYKLSEEEEKLAKIHKQKIIKQNSKIEQKTANEITEELLNKELIKTYPGSTKDKRAYILNEIFKDFYGQEDSEYSNKIDTALEIAKYQNNLKKKNAESQESFERLAAKRLRKTLDNFNVKKISSDSFKILIKVTKGNDLLKNTEHNILKKDFPDDKSKKVNLNILTKIAKSLNIQHNKKSLIQEFAETKLKKAETPKQKKIKRIKKRIETLKEEKEDLLKDKIKLQKEKVSQKKKKEKRKTTSIAKMLTESDISPKKEKENKLRRLNKKIKQLEKKISNKQLNLKFLTQAKSYQPKKPIRI